MNKSLAPSHQQILHISPLSFFHQKFSLLNKNQNFLSKKKKKTEFMNDHPSIPVSEYHERVQGEEDINDYEEDGSAGCFGVFGFPWKQSSSDNEPKYLLGECNTKTKKVTWWRTKLNKTKWKNLVRKIGAYSRRCKKQWIRLCKKKKPNNRFQYDFHSYALNFDNGADGTDGVVDFSARFAAPSN